MPLMPAQDPIQRAMAQAKAQQDMQQQLQQVLQSTIQNPHTREEVTVSLCVLSKDGPNHVLLVASPDGRRRDIHLSPGAVSALAKAAAEIDAQEHEDAIATALAGLDESQAESGLAT